MQIAQQLAAELNVKVEQIDAAIRLLDEGATVPFIARYRKEATQGLDDGHLRQLAQRLSYLRDLAERRLTILASIEQQGKLTAELKRQIEQADNKTRLEDLYLPFKAKRKTKGQIAIQAGLLPLAEHLRKSPRQFSTDDAQKYLNAAKGFATVDEVIEGIKSILAEQFAEDAECRAILRKQLEQKGLLVSQAIKGKADNASKYRDYFEHQEKYKQAPSHRVLAMLRGKNEGVLSLNIQLDEQQPKDWAQQLITRTLHLPSYQSPNSHPALDQAIHISWQQKLLPSLTTELIAALRDKAEADAIDVFAANLKDVLMAAPAGAKTTLGLDPGLRTGCKLAVVDATGKLLHTATIFPHEPQNNWDKSVRTLVNLCQQYKVELIAIGNGTASRESDKLVAEAIKQCETVKPVKVLVSEAGASVYSASELAAQEFPQIDVSLRGAISIARRLQDPLAELVKIDPKSIGVGQYQHDVSQSLLTQRLDNVIEDCVNAVGVDLNIASVPLLARVAGLNKTVAANIVQYREQHGRFNQRQQLLKVNRLGAKAYEQAAGFLRIRDAENPLDGTAVHPESYHLVEQIAQQLSCSVAELIGDEQKIAQITDSIRQQLAIGEYTFNDIIAELKKPSRDPRPTFKTAQFKEGINTINDLSVGMVLEGIVSNVANFGAFVDIGVHQDGLVHISSLTDKFVSDPRNIVKAGDVVKVKVIEVDVPRKRIGLTMRLEQEPISQTPREMNKQPTKAQGSSTPQKSKHHAKKSTAKPKVPSNAAMGNAFAEALAKLKK